MNYDDQLSEAAMRSQKFHNKYEDVIRKRKKSAGHSFTAGQSALGASKVSRFQRYMEKMNIQVKQNKPTKGKLMNTIRPGTAKLNTKRCLNRTQKKVSAFNSPYKERKIQKLATRPVTVRNKFFKNAKPRELYYLNQLNRKEPNFKNNFKIKEKAKRLNFSQVDPEDDYIVFKRRSKKGRRFNETTVHQKEKRRTFSVCGVEKPKNIHPNQEIVNQKQELIKRAVTPVSRGSALASSVKGKDDKLWPKYHRRCESTANRSMVGYPLMSRVGSPDRKRFNCLMTKPKNQENDVKSNAISEEFRKKAQTLKTVEDRIREKYTSSPAQNEGSIKRFKQLQEYLKMAHRRVKINDKIRNEEGRIVKGEIPLGTDTKIQHEVRENYPSILEIKRRLKNTLSIKCNFDEVLKYAKDYFGINVEEKSEKHRLLEEHKLKKEKEIQENEDSIKLYNNETPSRVAREDANLNDEKSQPENEEQAEADIVSQAHTNLTFTKKKWGNIDELISVLQEELADELDKRKEEIL